MALDEGYIKFNSDWERTPLPPGIVPDALKAVRDHLHRMGLVGIYPDGIGYGNVSVLLPDGRILITGSGTGGIAVGDDSLYSIVEEVDLARNYCRSSGMHPASSESMTHAALYACDPSIQAVVHVHHGPTWRALLGRCATTAPEVPYGTPAMAEEVKRLHALERMGCSGLIVMAGHEEGILAFGEDIGVAEGVILAKCV